MADDNNESYSVGYGKPPPEHRFKRGQSGNPRGRPKGSKNSDTLLAAELDARVVITENGRRKTITMRQVIMKQMVNQAAKGDPRARAQVLAETRGHDAATAGANQIDVFATSGDKAIIARFKQRILDEINAAAERAVTPDHSTAGEAGEGASPLAGFSSDKDPLP